MKKLLSLPPNLVGCFHDITGKNHDEWFCTNDPIGAKLGSGGGTTWAISKAREAHWLIPGERVILLHAGGQSRRLPAYAPSGKILTPIPVFRWKRGQRLSQTLLDLQLPLFEDIMQRAPQSLTTMVVSGDVYIRATGPLQPIPEADVVCYGLGADSSLARNHGVFVSKRATPDVLEYMLQKPSVETLSQLMRDSFFLMDIGIWLFSDKAMNLLMKRSLKALHTDAELKAEDVGFYDMYSEFGMALGANPKIADKELNELKVMILPLPGGEFHHYGTSPEMISSTLAVQNSVINQHEILRKGLKPHPSIFIQNAECFIKFTEQNANTWIENSYIGPHWHLNGCNIITGVPVNDWKLNLPTGVCIDIVPFGDDEWVVRPYEFSDPHPAWLLERLDCKNCSNPQQEARLYPIVDDVKKMEDVLAWMINGENPQGKTIWDESRKLTAEEISSYANLRRLTAQREAFRKSNWPQLASNWEKSIFYQLNLKDAADQFQRYGIPAPAPLPDTASRMTKISDAMFRSRLRTLKGLPDGGQEQRAFTLLKEGLTASALSDTQQPMKSVYADQIVWGRCPVRIDIAGGWTDTPPFCLMEGGHVVNLAIELNGQPPIQTYIKPSAEPQITLRSIDLGASEVVTSYEQLADFHHVGSPFSIPKAALVLAGFQPGFSKTRYASLREQLTDFGCGIELTLLSAIPAGSGLGTSSILAATVLGALNDFCGLMWDKNEIGHRTLVLEQLLTTGGGWQDQFGGLLHGVKLLQTDRGVGQCPTVRWLPSDIYTLPDYKACHLLFYTGITRTAKNILSEIVRRMFLNEHDQLQMLREMKEHATDMYEAIQRNDFERMGHLVAKTWRQNQRLDGGTNPSEVRALTDMVDDLCLGYKLPGAGGGGYLYMVAKDPEAAARIRQVLLANRLNANARFVDMSLSTTGLQVSRS